MRARTFTPLERSLLIVVRVVRVSPPTMTAGRRFFTITVRLSGAAAITLVRFFFLANFLLFFTTVTFDGLPSVATT